MTNLPSRREYQSPVRRLLDMPLSQFPSLWGDLEGDLAEWTGRPGLSIFEEKNSIIVEAPMPGLKPDNIEINFDKGILYIRGELKEEEESKERRYYRSSQRSYSFQTTLPQLVDEKQEPKATYKDGILRISFVKSKEREAKKIPVKSS